MQLSTVKRESLIPPAYLISIALLLLVAFIVLIPSRETFSFSQTNRTDFAPSDIDDLDLAYLKARDAAGDLSANEMRSVIKSMIRGEKWAQAQQLLTDRPDIQLDGADAFLLRLEVATAGYFGAGNEARSASFEANLTSLLTQLLDSPSLHDRNTLGRSAQISAELKQPELSASYNLLLATADRSNAVHYLEQCARILANYEMHGQAASCYRTAIAKSANPDKTFSLKRQLVSVLAAGGDNLAATAELESLVRTTPRKATQLNQLAELALAFERPDLAYPLYAEISQIDTERAVLWLEKATTWAVASNLPGLAAEYVLTITQLSDSKHTRALTKRRQALLLAAGRNEEALQTLHERIRAQQDSAELLIEGTALASSMGLTQQAKEWNTALLAIRPFDIDAMQRQIDLALANQQQDEARFWAEKLIDIDPLNKDHRLKLAQLEEWSGNIPAAQEHREWLATYHPTTANDQELVRLAELNWDAATAANALRRIAGREQLSTENIMKLVKLYEQDGRPDLASRALSDMMNGGQKDAILLREQAALHKRHKEYAESLQAWQTFATRYGQSSESSINQMELQWRLKRETQAVAAAANVEPQYLGNATDYQLKLLTEIGWRHRKPELVVAAAPYVQRLNLQGHERIVAHRRMIQSLVDSGDYASAIKYGENQWRETGDLEFLMTSMHLALDEDVYPHKERYLDANDDLTELRNIPDYWITVGDYYNRNGDTQAAIETYENTLMVQPDNAEAMTGLLWTLLADEGNNTKLSDALARYETAAAELPAAWAPFAVAHMKIKQPKASLRWFSKLMVKDDHDYNILLTFADALEQTGHVTHAFKVRSYALNKLRPLALAQAGENTNEYARDYVNLLRNYGSAGENEVWTERLVRELPGESSNELAWRRELAASWYLATQRSDYARLILTKSHEKRLETPVWQQLALALQEDDIGSVKEILASGKELSSGDQILALRSAGREKEAFALANNVIENGRGTDRDSAEAQVIALRNSRPGYTSGALKQREIGSLDITESGLSLRHTLAQSDLGFGVDYSRNHLASSRINVTDSVEDDISVSAYLGNSRHSGTITTGINTQGSEDLQYGAGKYFLRDRKGSKELNTEVSFNEVLVDGSAAMRLAAKQDRAELAYQHALSANEFVRVTGNLNEITSRSSDERISRGAAASLELGTTGSFGSNSWAMGVIASGSTVQESGALPLDAQGIPRFTQSPVIRTETVQQLALSASLFRGGINSDYPQAASPRYHMSARVGHNWPAESIALQVQAGAGFRLLGNDELSFQVAHDRSVDTLLPETSNSTVGIQYRNHF